MANPVTPDLAASALNYHRSPRPGKLEIQATKPLGTQHDLSLAYTPGVAAACLAIAADPAEATELTIRQNLVAVVTNGTAVLGLGDIGPLAAKPVMEGKAVLFKKFAGIDVFDIEIAENDIDRLVDIVASLEPTFGGINLEDIKAPQCFEVERKLRERMSIPVFHDDQHGTAIIVGAAVLNAMELTGKRLESIRIVSSGAGAAALACIDFLVELGARPENIFITDVEGVVYKGRAAMNERMAIYARDTNARRLDDVIGGADVFVGLSAGGVLTPEMAKKMGAASAHHGARQSDARDRARGRHRGASRRDDLHRPLGLSQSGQQRPLLSLHLSRRARCRRLDHQRGDEARRRARHRRARA